MAQFLRPDSNVTQTSFTGGFAEIDESTASDADFAYGAINTAATLEVGLANPSSTPASGTTTVRYRIARTNGAAVDGGGNAVDVTCHVYQGTTLIASDTARTATGTWTQYSFTPSMASVTDWNDLRLRFVTTASGGGPSVRRGAAVSWAEMEAPDGNPAISTLTDDFATLDTGKWTATNTNGTVSVASGALDLTTTGAAGSHATATSVGTFSFVGSEAYVQIVRRYKGTNNVDGARLVFRIHDSTDIHDYVEWYVTTNNVLLARTVENGGAPTHDTTISAGYDASGYTWLKLSLSGGTVTWWTAPDNGGVPGTWTSRHTNSTLPAGFGSNCKVKLWVENWGTGHGAITQSGRFDGFNTSVGSSLSAVGADSAQSYAIQAAVGADGAGSYGVVAAVGQDSAGGYAIAESAGQNQAGSYAVIASVGADHAGAYGVGGTVSADHAGAYGIVQTVGQDSAGSYAVHEAAGQDQAGAYAVIEAVGQSQAGSYEVVASVGADAAGSYGVVEAVGQSQGGAYGVVEAVGSDLSGAYAVAGVVGSDQAGAYTISASVGQDSAGAYGIGGMVGQDHAGSYGIAATVTSDQSGDFAILNSVGQDAAVGYAVIQAIWSDFDGSYLIDGESPPSEEDAAGASPLGRGPRTHRSKAVPVWLDEATHAPPPKALLIEEEEALMLSGLL